MEEKYFKNKNQNNYDSFKPLYNTIIKNIISNYIMNNNCYPFSKNVKNIVNSEYIINKIFNNPSYIFIIIYKLNIQSYFEIYIFYLIYLIAISYNKNTNISLLNTSLIALNDKLGNAFFKKINNKIKLIGRTDDYLNYNDEFSLFINVNNKLLNDNIVHDYKNMFI